MKTNHRSNFRSRCQCGHLLCQGSAGQGYDRSSGSSLVCAPEQSTVMCMICRKESAELGSSTSYRDSHCPVCLQTPSFPVQTNCGHLFCAPCLITYWRHGSWLDAISCPLCRQKVSVLCHLFNESQSDRQSKEVLGEITEYNRRYSGEPRRMTDYLCDASLLLQLMARGLGTMGGLVWLFFFRVVLCCVGTVMSISSPPLETVSSSSSSSSSSAIQLDSDPSLCGLLGVLDDLVVVILLLMCVININQQMVSERGPSDNTTTTTTQGMMGNSL
ncbi:E3 ubiquitin-protein ligase RNF170 [Cynoglossus semilaevis]|uniref:Si:dkey-183n20.15 n=1 Tax=Cynoglossus semilaevis TaxID=244447 RepID=A0A3P8VAA8_CYNSE|nr:E3 ubiquitin-protein ligase RNF170-like [Cynoglossus semilaevis]